VNFSPDSEFVLVVLEGKGKMAKEISPVAVSTKKLCAMFDLTRQRVNQLERDPDSGFPKPSRIGRSVRHNVAAVLKWLESMNGGSTAVQPKPLETKAPVVAHIMATSLQKAQPAQKALPTVAEVKVANAKVLALTPREGQKCYGNMIETAEGVPVKFFRMIPRHRDDPNFLSSTHQVVRYRSDPMLGKPIMKPKVVDKSEPMSKPNKGDSCAPEPGFSSPAESGYRQPSVGRAAEVSPDAMKGDYESGLSLDAICKRYRIGKSRASMILLVAGAAMRKPGRTTKPSAATNPLEVK
jgi:predicted DNA-binding transcriptional regulator AlpA